MKRLAASALLTAALAFAQWPGGGRPRPMAAGSGSQGPGTDLAQTYLGLSASQVSQLQQIQQDERSANQGLHQQIADKEQALQTALSGSSSSAADLGNLLLDIQNLRSQIKQNRQKYQTQALALLNAGQVTKLQALQAAAALQPTIRQAEMLNLLTPPTPPAGSAGPMGGPGDFVPMGRGARR